MNGLPGNGRSVFVSGGRSPVAPRPAFPLRSFGSLIPDPPPLRATFLGSSMAEHPAVNRRVAGSSPARGAIRLRVNSGALRRDVSPKSAGRRRTTEPHLLMLSCANAPKRRDVRVEKPTVANALTARPILREWVGH